MDENCKCKNVKTKKRTNEDKKNLTNRLNRIEGQVRGIKKMLENDAYCTDILTQVSAVQSALNSFAKEILEEHVKTCVVNDIKEGNEEVIDDLLKTIRKLMK
ncbi:metal-sensing transcriptional repressor [Clostridium sp. HCP1S3_B4]|uniref:metal-sensing transcriptional repressor n=1 Tax=unclassified Clostridium TaxID=2614128 RepID=UPI0016A9BE88|nr:metal-sensing transcriptional repressor [Clostridiales bacterium]NLK23462.1 metal-sensing transcriptional repressor [Clostridiales bacterium]